MPQFVQSARWYRRLQVKLRRKSVRKRLVRTALLATNVLILVIILVFVLQNSHAPSEAAASPAALSNQATPAAVSNPLDQLSSADIALTVARLDNLPETTAISNQADSQTTELALAATDDNVITKPQVVATALKSRADIEDYVTQPGDTLSSLAVKFGVTSDSIRWSNNLSSSNTLQAGLKLVIPPVNGIVYTVKAGDTPASLAARYGASEAQIVAYNDAEISGLQPGEQIIIPNGTVSAPVITASSGWYGASATYGSNGYDFGYCTWWVAKLRAQAGDPLPTNLGNASTWAIRAGEFGIATGTTPAVGAAVVTSTAGEGHVAYVEAVNPDGSIVVSEMNRDGWDRVDTATMSGDYTYIY